MMYWLGATIIAWAILSIIGLVWEPLQPTSAITILFAMSAGCFANSLRNCTYHCFFDAPLLLAAGVIFLLRKYDFFYVPAWTVWLPLLLGVAISFYLEWRFAKSHSA